MLDLGNSSRACCDRNMSVPQYKFVDTFISHIMK